MTLEKKIINKYYKWIFLLIPLVAIFITLLFRFEGIPNRFSTYAQLIHSIFFTAVIWIGCMSIVGLLWTWFPWEIYPVKHLILEVLLILIFTNTFALLIYKIEMKVGLVKAEDDIYLDIVITNLITFLITTIHEAVFFYQQWKHNFSKSVRLEKDNIEAKYETLKTQINPHFLFNSLNSLTSLVDDNEQAVSYIQNLSEFLRYILKSRDRELVLVREEIKIAEQYLNLQKTRFNESLKVNLDVPEKTYHYSLPPLVIQMLIENCIKHNVVSKDKPLTIKIFTENKLIVVENNLQKKNAKDSTGHGLNNIKERLKFFTTREIIISETSSTFAVKVPLLEVEL